MRSQKNFRATVESRSPSRFWAIRIPLRQCGTEELQWPLPWNGSQRPEDPKILEMLLNGNGRLVRNGPFRVVTLDAPR
jgi:hypothetical protein